MPEAPIVEPDRPNQQVLEELCRLLRFSQGEFELILAVCNSTQHRRVLVDQLRRQCPIPFDEITLASTTSTLFTTIRAAISDPPPEALMVYGLDGVQDLNSVLTAANQIREEFRQFPFPLVLWLTDDSLKHLIRTAPDFYTWANSITFETPPEFFLSFLDDLIQDVWRQVAQSQENRFLSNQELGLTPSSPQVRELETSLAVLAAHNMVLTPAQSAALAFVQGRIADNNTSVAREYYECSLDQWQALLSQNGQTQPQAAWPENVGHIQFHLGLWWRNRAERHRRGFETACNQARKYFAAAVQTFEQAQRPDLAAKYINYWAEALHRLDQWEALETVATKALSQHQSEGDVIRQARAAGFLAEVALAQNDWPTAQRHAEAALALIPLMTKTNLDDLSQDEAIYYAWVNSFHLSWYLFSLGKAQFRQGSIDAAVQILEQARTITQPEYDPKLYSSVLEQLRQGYFQQGKYLQAFETRRHKDAIESRFNYRAFVGAGRLQPKQQITNPALPAEANPKDLIFTSGRKQDVKRLIKRLAQDEYVLTIIYGPSGVGKSSLIEAGLTPALEQGRFGARRVTPVYLWRYRDWVRDLTAAIPFRKGRESTSPGLSTQPERLSQAEMVLDLLHQQTQHNQVMVLIFDQFEEFFFEFDQPAARRPFYDFLRDCLAMPYVKVVLSMREDYIHHLLECDRLTPLAIIDNNILDKKWLYYLGNFSPDDTKTVFNDLTEPTPYNPEPALVDQVVADLAAGAGEVRPIELQIVGAQLQAEGITTPEVYRDWGDPSLPTKELLVQKYLADIVKECGPPENQQLADIVLYLLTDETGVRPLKTQSDLADDLLSFTNQTELDDAALSLVLKILTQSGLVMEEPEAPEDRYQLVHDYLAAFIHSSQQPLMVQLGQERRMRAAAEQQRFEEQQRRIEAERKQLRQAQRAAVGLGALAFLAIGVVALIWVQQQQALKDKVNAQFLAESLKMEAYLEAGLEEAAVTQAMRTAQALKGKNARRLEPATRFRAISSIREVMFGVKDPGRLIGHSAPVWSVAFSPDGETIASASEDYTVKLWSKDGEELQTLRGHSAEVLNVAFSPDGETIASASGDNTVKLWSKDGETLQTLRGHNDLVEDVAFSPDGKTIASASDDSTVKLWSKDGEVLQTLQGHRAPVMSVAFSPDRETIASASEDNTVKLWSKDGEALQTLRGHSDWVGGVTFSPDGETIASASGDNTVKLWSKDGEALQTLQGHSNEVLSVTFSPDGETIASASEDDTVKLWSKDGEALQTLRGHSGWWVGDVAFSPDGETIASASGDNTVKLWSKDSEALQTLRGHNDLVGGVAFSPDGETIASASDDNTVKLWSKDGEALQTLRGHRGWVEGVAFSPDGETIASASKDNTVKLWSKDGEALQTFQGHRTPVRSVIFSPDGETIASASEDNTVKLWTKDGEELQTFQGHRDWVRSVTFSPDGETIASASDDNTVKLWAKDGEELQTLQGHSAPVWSVAFSPDGETIASASVDRTVKLWSKAGEALQTLRGHSAEVWSVAFSPDGETIASASEDNTVKLWSKDGEALQTLRGHRGWVVSVAFSPDGETIASASEDKTVKLWNFQLEDLISRGCNWLGAYFVKQSPELLMELEVCQEHDPSLTVAAAPLLVTKGEDLVRQSKTKQGINLLQQAIVWDNKLEFDPRRRARDVADAHNLFTEGENLAQKGAISEAAAMFAEAQKLDLKLDFDPEIQAKELAVEAYVDKGRKLVNNGDVEGAVQAYLQAETVGLGEGISVWDWNFLCWHGSLYNQAEKVIFACEKAIALNPQNGDIIDSRGLARALTGDTQGAIADFKVFVAWTSEEDSKAQRQAWIEALERGENPFTPEVLESLSYYLLLGSPLPLNSVCRQIPASPSRQIAFATSSQLRRATVYTDLDPDCESTDLAPLTPQFRGRSEFKVPRNWGI